MSIQIRNPSGEPEPTAPGKPGSRQPPDANTGADRDADEEQDIPESGRDPVDAIVEDAANDIPTDDDDDDDDDADEDQDDDDDEDDDEAGSIELPAEGGDRDRLSGSRVVDNQ